MAARKTATKTGKAAKGAGKAVKRVVAGQRELQRRIDRKDAAGAGAAKPAKKAIQGGVRRQPVRMPAQHLAKPGREADLELAPRCEGPGYRGSG